MYSLPIANYAQTLMFQHKANARRDAKQRLTTQASPAAKRIPPSAREENLAIGSDMDAPPALAISEMVYFAALRDQMQAELKQAELELGQVLGDILGEKITGSLQAWRVANPGRISNNPMAVRALQDFFARKQEVVTSLRKLTEAQDCAQTRSEVVAHLASQFSHARHLPQQTQLLFDLTAMAWQRMLDPAAEKTAQTEALEALDDLQNRNQSLSNHVAQRVNNGEIPFRDTAAISPYDQTTTEPDHSNLDHLA